MKSSAVIYMLSSLAAGLVMGSAPAQADSPWVIKKASWSAADESSYSKFVESIYESKCNTVLKCMTGKGNWYRDRDPDGIHWYADCGRFPYLLRSYFAFHNNLPFENAVDAERRDPNDPNPVLQYSARGNYIAKRKFAQTGVDAYKYILNAVESAYTALYRVDSTLDSASGKFSDMYHVKITREFIRPGTIVYDPNGHVAQVAHIGDDGKVTLLDSHPDNSVSRVPYTSAFQATSRLQSGGFKNWRPIKLVGAKSGSSGELLGGTVQVPNNADIPGFSLEQFVGDQPNPRGSFGSARWSTSDGVLGSKQFVSVIRARLSVGAVTYHPVREVSEGVNTICEMLTDRAQSVKQAINDHIDARSMPAGRLPQNIYGTDGEWESYSTPSRDARLRTAAAEFRTLVEKMVDLSRARSPKVVYSGTDLTGDMVHAYDQAAAACQLSYTKSNGAVQSVSYQSAIERLYAMSFDPYHCAELRWGASSPGELATCSGGGDKLAWYRAEQGIRNSLERKYEVKMDWTLAQLQAGTDVKSGVGSKTQTPVDVRAFLAGSAPVPVVLEPAAPEPAPAPAPAPVPAPVPPVVVVAPTPAPLPAPPVAKPTIELCQGRFHGSLRNGGEAADVKLSNSKFALSVKGEVYLGHGTCTTGADGIAKLNFALDDDANYVFRGTISAANGKVSLSADQFKNGGKIDHLSAAQ